MGESRTTALVRFTLVAAVNPCQCGYYGDSTRECSCSNTMVSRQIRRLAGEPASW